MVLSIAPLTPVVGYNMMLSCAHRMLSINYNHCAFVSGTVYTSMYGILLGLVILLIILIIYTGTCPSQWPGQLCAALDRMRRCKSCAGCSGGSNITTAPAAEGYRTNSCIGTFDCMGENFTSTGDIAANTMMRGFQYRSTLPG